MTSFAMHGCHPLTSLNVINILRRSHSNFILTIFRQADKDIPLIGIATFPTVVGAELLSDKRGDRISHKEYEAVLDEDEYSKQYYHGSISVSTAEERLHHEKPGTFLLRSDFPDINKGIYNISVKTKESIVHLLVSSYLPSYNLAAHVIPSSLTFFLAKVKNNLENRFSLENSKRHFDKIWHLVNAYKKLSVLAEDSYTFSDDGRCNLPYFVFYFWRVPF